MQSPAMPARRRARAAVAASLFVLALLMGAGPVAALVGGEAGAPNFLFGVPALYLWLVFWFAVMAGCVVYAAVNLWSDD